MLTKATWAGITLGAALLLAGAGTAQAQGWNDGGCRARIRQEQNELNRAVDRFGLFSRQANEERNELRNTWARCGGWFGDGDNDRDDRWRRGDGDNDRDDRWVGRGRHRGWDRDDDRWRRGDGDNDRDDRGWRNRDRDHDRDRDRDRPHDRDRDRDHDHDRDRH